MVNATDLFFDAFGNYNRFRILNLLRDKELCASELQKELNIEQTNLSHDLKCLINCQFLTFRKDGKKRIYSIEPDAKKLVDGVSKYIKKYESYLKKCGILN
ncbi:MAG: regulatory protein ArsR [Candidatus Parvarchaeum acidophilus ARMAN-5]|uniref:Regulatory protein ArsR n=1 Tax=Candidatus Parvarchaeum acidophilus ARMAN-5 TaxID=662762 RepID=D6GVA3_PARA5|nr:MAG: regulatory protein ArsR [Candidatus Parvarchaeum acidophilus ARMAN-5]